ncbi:FAD:protein FMN transferase [Dactylosporangium matsuzakiense]|uniref:FAD:protein FMN transferase n=1 Tax=Dactylosporangium matsuzakiense TaxID=53360 RepID=A0A9W6KWV5_9ACTN|nr:FAD:protein FMN transferase [Dactylosporangium matsuzakiense]GLL06924.1 FAD:protein FMN transferase [Dactylosporangium matsuzakiense]
MSTVTLPRRAWVEQIMGLPMSIHVRGADPDAAEVQQRVTAVFTQLRHADAVFSPYRDDSELSRWERGELAVEAADPTFAEVLALCEEARERTGGWFDARALPDPRTGAPRFDPSGLVKGWAVERAAEQLQRLRGYSWCVNAGGDVLVHALEEHPAWRIGIESPDDPSRLLQVLERRSGAVATSGPAHRGAHIVDPHTGRPATGVRAVTVTGPQLLWADVYATAAAARGARALPWLETLDEHAALLVSASGLLQVTAGWPPR